MPESRTRTPRQSGRILLWVLLAACALPRVVFAGGAQQLPFDPCDPVFSTPGHPGLESDVSIGTHGVQTCPPVDGLCGPANRVPTTVAPAPTRMCSAGTASAVTPNAGTSTWLWTCAGTNGSTVNASCSAPAQQPVEGGGPIAVVSGYNGWDSDRTNSGIVAPSTLPSLPTGYTSVRGIVGLRLIGGIAGTTATVTLNYPAALPPGTVYYKYGRTPGNTTARWYPYPGAVISGSTITLTLTDGGDGDDDLSRNGQIIDPGGPVLPPGVPTLPEWALFSTVVGLLALGALALHRRQAAQ